MKHEIFREAIDITFYRLVKVEGLNAIKSGKVLIQHHLSAPE